MLENKVVLSSAVVLVIASSLSLAIDSSVPFIHADDVHSLGITGQGITVVVIDTGVDLNHPGLSEGIAPGGLSIVNSVLIKDDGADVLNDSHGTQMSLIITDSAGVAPAARILPVRVLGHGGINPFDVVRAIEYVTQLRKVDPSIRVINLSLGEEGPYQCSCDNDDAKTRAFAPAIQAAEEAGIITFAATGNAGRCGNIVVPACVSQAVRVAANYDLNYQTTDFGICGDFIPPPYRVTCFSDIAENCDWLLAAPGYDITVGGFSPVWGTSPATAHCSGVAALMFEKNLCGPLGADTARTIIFNTATINDWAYPVCPLSPQPRHVNAYTAVNAVSAGACGVAGDLDCDDTVSGFDTPRFADCMTGPGGGLASAFCACADFPTSPPDGDVDLQDYAAFQRAFTGYGSGACCHEDGSCTEGLVIDCVIDPTSAYQGHDSTCAAVECPLPNWGACCDIDTQDCTESSEEDCVWGGGFYMGDATGCATAECPAARYHNVIDPLVAYKSSGTGMQLADDITLSGVGPYSLAFYDLGVFGGGGGPFDVTVGLYTDCPGYGGTLIAGTERTFTDNPDNGSPVFLQATFNPPIPLPNDLWMVTTYSRSQAGWFIAEQPEVGLTGDFYGRDDLPWQCNYNPPNYYDGLWASIGCIEPIGACCFADESCIEDTQANCSASEGIYHGPGTVCASTDCSGTDVGACCDPDDGTCTEAVDAVCTAAGGDYQGDGTVCAGVTCPYGQYRNEIDPITGIASQAGALALADDLTLAGTGARELVYYDLLVYGNGGGTFNATVSLYDGCPATGGAMIPGTSNTWNGVPDDGYDYLLARDLSASPVTIPDTVWMVVQFSNADAAWIIAETAEIGSTTNYLGVNLPPWGCNYQFQGGAPYAGFWANLRCVAEAGMRSGGHPSSTMTPVHPLGNVELTDRPANESGVLPGAGRAIGSGGYIDDSSAIVQGTLSLEVQPIGGGAPVGVLAANTEYELHYAASHGSIHTYLAYVIAPDADASIAAAAPPDRGDWAKAGNFFFMDFRKDDAPAPVLWMLEEHYYYGQIMNGFWGITDASAGASGHLMNFKTGSSGKFAFKAYAFGDLGVATVYMEDVLELTVEPDE